MNDQPNSPADFSDETIESDPVDAPDASLGGYVETHDRPPAFEGPDGHPYTVSIEVEKTPDLAAPYLGYLVFPRWAATGVGIVGHVESPVLVKSRSSDAARLELLGIPLTKVKVLLDQAVQRQNEPLHGG